MRFHKKDSMEMAGCKSELKAVLMHAFHRYVLFSITQYNDPSTKSLHPKLHANHNPPTSQSLASQPINLLVISSLTQPIHQPTNTLIQQPKTNQPTFNQPPTNPLTNPQTKLQPDHKPITPNHLPHECRVHAFVHLVRLLSSIGSELTSTFNLLLAPYS